MSEVESKPSGFPFKERKANAWSVLAGEFDFQPSVSKILAEGFVLDYYKNMRIWDIAPKKLCRNHLLGEHRELHAIWSVLTRNKKGYSQHPETLRWKGKLAALYVRHKMLADEMNRRGYNHYSNLNRRLAIGIRKQCVFVDSRKKQTEILRSKNCSCRV